VEASNEYGWVIPMPQIALHTTLHPDDADDFPPQPTEGKRRWSFWR